MCVIIIFLPFYHVNYTLLPVFLSNFLFICFVSESSMATQYMQPQVPVYHGYSSQQQRYDSSSMQGKNGGFAFRKRFERLDWRKIASVDVDQISRTLDFNSLQENIMNITFCNIETEVVCDIIIYFNPILLFISTVTMITETDNC